MDDKSYPAFWDGVKGVCTVLIVCAVSFKFYNMPISMSVDFPTLLSLILAIFSVCLSALFYFKATDTSNKFYDNTYKFTRDIAQLLVKMESGFGEKLKNLDEGYASVRGYLQSGFGGKNSQANEENNKKLKGEMEEFKKAVEERNEIVKELIERSQLEAEDKEKISQTLKDKESEISALQNQIAKLSRRKTLERLEGRSRSKVYRDGLDFSNPMVRVDNFIRTNVLDALGGGDWVEGNSSTAIIKKFSTIQDAFPPSFIEDLNELGLYRPGALSTEGVRLIERIAFEESFTQE